MAKKRNLVIGLDGTWNETTTPNPTNVERLLSALRVTGQEQHYEEGVGTAHNEALPGGIYGKGLNRQIQGAYRKLRAWFAQKEWQRDDNNVFIFGFSRGAYAARRLAGLINHSGIPAKAKDAELGWHIYLNRDAASAQALKEKGDFFDIKVAMLGVWDTVKTTTDADFNDHKLPDCVAAGCHALAIDERRKFFPVLHWDADPRVTQRWFAGVHCDVGGGYPETELADITLKWMVDHACYHGLAFKGSYMKAIRPDSAGEIHDSCQGIWAPLGTKVRSISNTEAIHVSVKERKEKLANYRPGNVPEDAGYLV